MAIAFISNTTAAQTNSFSHTATAETDLLLVKTAKRSIAVVTEMTYNGVSMTEILQDSSSGTGNNRRGVAMHRLLSPAAVTADVVITWQDQNNRGYSAENYSGVNQTTPNRTPSINSNDPGGTGKTTSPASAVDDLVVDIVSINGGQNLTADAGQTVRANFDATVNLGVGSSEKAGAATSTSMTWSWDNQPVIAACHGAVALVPAAVDDDVTAEPSTGNVQVTGNTPAIGLTVNTQPGNGVIAVTGNIPGITATMDVTPTQGSIRVSGNTPSIEMEGDTHIKFIASSSGTDLVSGETSVTFTGHAIGDLLVAIGGTNSLDEPAVTSGWERHAHFRGTFSGAPRGGTIATKVADTTDNITVTFTGSGSTATNYSGGIAFRNAHRVGASNVVGTGGAVDNDGTVPSPSLTLSHQSGRSALFLGTYRTSSVTGMPDGAIIADGVGYALDRDSWAAGNITFSVNVLNISAIVEILPLDIASPQTGRARASGNTPEVEATTTNVVQPGTGRVAVMGSTPAGELVALAQPGTGLIHAVGMTPDIEMEVRDAVFPQVGRLLARGNIPAIGLTAEVTPGTGLVRVAGNTPVADEVVTPSRGRVRVRGLTPGVFLSQGGMWITDPDPDSTWTIDGDPASTWSISP